MRVRRTIQRPFRPWRLALIAALALLSPVVEPSEGAPPAEYEVKAAFLYNFARYVEWPPGSFDKGDSPIIIGVLGDDPFGSHLDEVVKDEMVRSRKLVVRRGAKAEDLKGCQLVFVSRSEKGRLEQDLAALGPGAVLTVSDIDGFAENGGVIRLFLAGKRIHFEINQTAAKNHELKLSAQLLSLGKIVDPVEGAAAP